MIQTSLSNDQIYADVPLSNFLQTHKTISVHSEITHSISPDDVHFVFYEKKNNIMNNSSVVDYLLDNRMIGKSKTTIDGKYFLMVEKQ